MSDNDFDSIPDNEWDDTWELAWSEFDWERYLRDQDEIMQTYLGHYEKHLERADRIDEVAHIMGWDDMDWTSDEAPPGDAAAPAPDSSRTPGDDALANGKLDPYTIQKHPVFISTCALFSWLTRTWEFVAPACGPKMPMRTSVAFATALSRAEHLGFLAIHSLDMGDYSLAVSLIKRALTHLNGALRQIQAIEAGIHPAFAQFRRHALIRIFDIREIWLRVMRDCRDELNRRVGGAEN